MRKEAAVQKTTPSRKLQILYVEDDGADLELCLRALKKANMEFHCDAVSTFEQFTDRISAQDYDIVLADYQLGGWTGMDALVLLREKRKDTPFILVTGSLGEEKAVECLKNGVDDYLLKGHLTRLPSAIYRALMGRHAREEQLRAHEALRESEEKFRTLAEAIVSPIFIYQGTECHYANRAAEEITGYKRDELLSMSAWEIIHPDSRDILIEKGLARLQGKDGLQQFELKILTREGQAKWLDITIRLIDFGGKPAGLFTGSDITERKSTEDEVRLQVASDSLTGLANGRRLIEVFAAEAKRSQRTNRSFSLVLLDLDDLKKINDSHGHLAGSRALCRVANILRNECRSGDIAARHGGDEFAVILPETDMEGAQLLSRRIRERLSSDGQQPALSVSTGAAVYPQDGKSYEELFETADRAMYRMKGNGGGKLLEFA